MKIPTAFLLIAGAYGLAAVVLGAFGAHALDARLVELGTKAVWETAVDYQMWHALAILVIVALRFKGGLVDAAAFSFSIGIPLFSGSLYWLALDGPRWLGPITPLGGLLFIVGWILFMIAAFRHEANS
ncbi:MAG: DUF423 domain-containing protein [Verrucomicrobia bacterium]|jgi:uncharacterized membrane protein YgdD (TMEM256/DUF423 family)|nr:DUF423 domain-containing protein [Verrucomicrobiota bacterium]